MWPQLAATLFGGSLLGWLSHALYVRPNKGNRDLANAVDNVLAPVVLNAANSALGSVANGQAVNGSAIASSAGQQITSAALGAIQAALTGPHTAAAAPVVTRAAAKPAAPEISPEHSDGAPSDAPVNPLIAG